jgi:hypothetical protein
MSIFGENIKSQKFGGQYFQIARVKSIVLGPFIPNTNPLIRDPDYKSQSDIGKIRYEILYSTQGTSKSRQVSEPAWPIFNFIRQYPLINEIVLIIAGPTERLNDRSTNQQFFYFPPYSVWNRSNHGAFPNMLEYAKYLQQTINEPGYSGNATTGSFPLGSTFEERSIRNIQPFEGDTIIQSRFGQSIRFGSTVQGNINQRTSKPEVLNNWSAAGNNGDPITIILNSQPKADKITEKQTLVEDINKDGSAIWMTSTQAIFLEDITKSAFPLNSFGISIDPIQQPTLTTQYLPVSNQFISAEKQDRSNID